MRLVTSALILALISPVAFAARLYRFNVDGQMIMKDHVPPEYAQMGYDILNDQGLVVKRISPAPTPEELAALAAQEAIKKARLERIRIRREADQALLRVYSKPADVERARKRKVGNIDGYISLQQRRIVDLTEKLERAQARAANYERSGQEIPVDMRLEIAQLQNQIRESHSNIKTRNMEKVESTKVYAEEYSRMQILLKYPPGTLESDIPLDAFD
jgi:paraquat-inducible protein B|tara:strand:- start:36 stop:683 length:648 start_codon:yes stop_codon:yes gene_type:complete